MSTRACILFLLLSTASVLFWVASPTLAAAALAAAVGTVGVSWWQNRGVSGKGVEWRVRKLVILLAGAAVSIYAAWLLLLTALASPI